MQPGFRTEHRAHFVSCLAIDLIGSTAAGLALTTITLDRFNVALVEQIKPHLDALGLEDSLVKFTGDGWLVISADTEKVPPLCCLAMLIANRFQYEMSKITEIPPDRIPALRLAICGGRDVQIALPDGRNDWVGDSARRATRVSGYCYPNEILIDEPVRLHVFRDFQVRPANVKARPPEFRPKRMEEEVPAYMLGPLKPETAEEPGSPYHFVYTLGSLDALRRETSSISLMGYVPNGAAPDQGAEERESLQRMLRSFNLMLSGPVNYEDALNILKNIRDAGLRPDVETYKALINRSPDYRTVRTWVKTMYDESIHLDRGAFNALIQRAPDYSQARTWLEAMLAEQVEPDVLTYNTLIAKAPDYNAAKACVDSMQDRGIKPDGMTHKMLLGKRGNSGR